MNAVRGVTKWVRVPWVAALLAVFLVVVWPSHAQDTPVFVTDQPDAAALGTLWSASVVPASSNDVLAALGGSAPALGSATPATLLPLADQGLIAAPGNASGVPQGLAALGGGAFVPWGQQHAYVTVIHIDALPALPSGAQFSALTWDSFAAWGANIAAQSGQPRVGLPFAADDFGALVAGHLWPSYTGGVVTTFDSSNAQALLGYAATSLRPTLAPASTNAADLTPLLRDGRVWLAIERTDRVLPLLQASPETFLAAPIPAGPSGRALAPALLALATNSPGSAVAAAFSPDAQSAVLNELGVFPVVQIVSYDTNDEGLAALAGAVTTQTHARDALFVLLPGDGDDDVLEVYAAAFTRALNGEDPATLLGALAPVLQAALDAGAFPCRLPDAPAATGETCAVG